MVWCLDKATKCGYYLWKEHRMDLVRPTEIWYAFLFKIQCGTHFYSRYNLVSIPTQDTILYAFLLIRFASFPFPTKRIRGFYLKTYYFMPIISISLIKSIQLSLNLCLFVGCLSSYTKYKFNIQFGNI
jgi:hypothetical protein